MSQLQPAHHCTNSPQSLVGGDTQWGFKSLVLPVSGAKSKQRRGPQRPDKAGPGIWVGPYPPLSCPALWFKIESVQNSFIPFLLPISQTIYSSLFLLRSCSSPRKPALDPPRPTLSWAHIQPAVQHLQLPRRSLSTACHSSCDNGFWWVQTCVVSLLNRFMASNLFCF